MKFKTGIATWNERESHICIVHDTEEMFPHCYCTLTFVGRSFDDAMIEAKKIVEIINKHENSPSGDKPTIAGNDSQGNCE